MPTNDFLPFGTAAGANVTDQATWSGLAARTAGFSAGVASSAQVNKALRQAGFIAAAVAQFAADNQAGNVADDGIVANFEAQLTAAIKAAATAIFTGSAQSKAVPGYQKLPGGFILQMGVAATNNANGSVTVTLPTAFTSSSTFVVMTTNQASAPPTSFSGCNNTGAGSFVLWAANSSGVSAGTGQSYFWFAIGY